MRMEEIEAMFGATVPMQALRLLILPNEKSEEQVLGELRLMAAAHRGKPLLDRLTIVVETTANTAAEHDAWCTDKMARAAVVAALTEMREAGELLSMSTETHLQIWRAGIDEILREA